jgi:hypothetical protein
MAAALLGLARFQDCIDTAQLARKLQSAEAPKDPSGAAAPLKAVAGLVAAAEQRAVPPPPQHPLPQLPSDDLVESCLLAVNGILSPARADAFNELAGEYMQGETVCADFVFAALDVIRAEADEEEDDEVWVCVGWLQALFPRKGGAWGALQDAACAFMVERGTGGHCLCAGAVGGARFALAAFEFCAARGAVLALPLQQPQQPQQQRKTGEESVESVAAGSCGAGA